MLSSAMSAVVAEPSAAERGRLCDMLASLGCAHALEAEDGLAALALVDRHLPDALLVNLTLPPSDGVWLARRVLSLPLAVRPGIVLMRLPGMLIPERERLLESGVAVADRPLARDGLLRALRETDVRVRRVPAALGEKLDALLDRLGVPEHEGRAFLGTAVRYAWMDARLARRLTTALYPLVGERHGVRADKVERSMRYAIELAWKHGRIDEQYAIFRGTIDAQRGKPTCGEMIAQLADILRMEEV